MDLQQFEFSSWRDQLVYNNDADANDHSYSGTQQFIFNKLTNLHTVLQSINSNYDPKYSSDLLYTFTQLSSFLNYLFSTYEKSKDVKILSVNISKLFAKTLTTNLFIMMKNGHEKFNILLIETVNKLNDLLLSNVKKISMSKNWYSSLKHLSVITLQFIFTKFSGFLNSYKNQLLTALYKHLSKANDSYNSSIENGLFKSNYFSDISYLIDIILTHDNSNLILDDKLLNRLFKLVKILSQKNTSSTTSSIFTYPLVSIVHSFSILISLLKSDRFIGSITSNKKSPINSDKFFYYIKEHTCLIFSMLDTDHKKLKLGITKNLADLLVFTFIMFGANSNDIDNALNSCLSLLLSNYRKSNTSSNSKSALVETLVQFLAKLNLFYQTNRVQASKNLNNVNFISLKLFDILKIIYSNLFKLSDPKLSKKKKDSTSSENEIFIDNLISLNFGIKTLNHLELIHNFLIKEIDNDSNKLICLSKIILGNSSIEPSIKIQCLEQTFLSNDETNIWYTTNLLKFGQLLIDNLNEFILSDNGIISESNKNNDIASQLVYKIEKLALHENFRLRLVAVETLIKLLKIKPELSFEILNQALENISNSFTDSSNNKNSFNNNYSNSYLISSILSFSSKTFITSDFVLKVFSMSLDFLKKFNTSVVSNNLFGSNSGSYVSNLDYEKQLVSWILLLGLFNYASNDENIQSHNLFLQDSNQFLSIWKNLLAHSVPNGFIQIEGKSIKNLNEVMKIIEIKNQSLVCLITYISYLNSNKSLINDELLRQLNQILIKSYTFTTILNNELANIELPQYLESSITGNKLRIFEAYLKLLPHLNIKNEINSTMLLQIVKNFTDIEKFRYKFKDPYGKYIKTSKKKIHVNKMSEYAIYSIDDGSWYGLTSKFNNFKIDELMIKGKTFKVINNKSESDIDLIPFHNQFLIESSKISSNLSNISIFDDTTESRNFNFLNHSILHDPFMLLYNNSYDVGYTDTMKYPVPFDTMTIDTSIELFAISFPHLSSKIQLSVLETIRSYIFYKSKESSNKLDTVDEESKIKLEFSLMLRKKAIAVNSSIAIHSLLHYINRYNSTNSDNKIYLKYEVAKVIIETLKNINYEDVYLVNLNSESIGLCHSLIDDKLIKEESLTNQVSIIINEIAENTDPNIRAFNIKTLANLTNFSNMINTNSIINTIFTLLSDPHPIVHAASMFALDTFLNGKSNLEISEPLINKIFDKLQNIWLNDEYGIRSNIIISSNINFREHSNSVTLIIKLIRSIINVSGPMIRLWNEELKNKLSNLLINLQYLTTFDYEILSREYLKIFEELLVFDKSIVNLSNFKTFTKVLIINNFKLGVYGHSLSNLPFDDDYDNENTIEIFPCTTSEKLLNMSLESVFQLFKIGDEEIIDEQFEQLLWIALEINPSNESIKNIVRILMEDSISKNTDERFLWFNKLLKYFNINKTEISKPLMQIFEKRINKAGMYFHIPTDFQNINKQKNESINKNDGNVINKSFNPEDENNEAEENLTSETVKKNVKNGRDSTNGGGIDDDDDDADDEDNDSSPNYGKNIDNNDDIDMINLLDLSNEQINWKFKLFIIEMLNKLLSYCETDQKLKISLSKSITEFIRVSFISSTSNLITLRIESLKLLGKIIELYSKTKDPLYPDISILDQQQAQIMSAIMPAFNKESSIELAGEGILLSSKFISSNVTDIKKFNRILKILINSIENLALNGSSNETAVEKRQLKIGEISILTKKSENVIKIYVLQAWSRLLMLSTNEETSSIELTNLINTYIKVLIPLWVNSIREYSMIKYGDLYLSEGINLEIYEKEYCWIDFIESICLVIDNSEYYKYLVDLLDDGIGKLYMMIFSLCLEYLIKRFNKINIQYNQNDDRIFKCFKKLMKVELTIKILFNDYIFTEFIDVINKWIVITDNNNLKLDIIDLLKNIFIIYFDDVKNVDGKSVEEIYADFDKLFELLRLNTKILISKLPFIKDKEIINNKEEQVFEFDDLILIKKIFYSLIEMSNKLPIPIQIDLYSNYLYMLTLIKELNNEQLIIFLLPVYQKVIIHLKSIDPKNTNIENIFEILKPGEDNKSDTLLCFIILKTNCELSITNKDLRVISNNIINSLISEDSSLVSFSVQTIKSITENLQYESCERIMEFLIPELISLISNNEKRSKLSEPRLIIEILTNLIKRINTIDGSEVKLIASYELLLPILIFFNKTFENYESYINKKMNELIEFKPEIFKKVLMGNVDSELKHEIQLIIEYNTSTDGLGNGRLEEGGGEREGDEEGAHIELKTFG